MVTGHVRTMQLRDPRKVKIIYERDRWSPIWDHNPRIAGRKDKDVQEYRPRVNGLRPYCTKKTPDRWWWTEYKPEVGEFYFSRTEQNFASMHHPEIIVEPSVKEKASPNKDWGIENWQRLVVMLNKEGFKVSQMGGRDTPRLSGAYFIETDTFRQAAAVLARAKAAVLPEGGLHHAAAAVGVRSVVLFGGFISEKQTGYDMHVNIFTGGEPCGWRKPCDHCKEAMAKITPDMVLHELKGILEASAVRP